MSEVSSTDVVGEKEQISVPSDLYHDFERLKHVTNLNTVDLMRKLLVDYHRSPGDDLLATMCHPSEPSQNESPDSNDQQQSTDEFDAVSLSPNLQLHSHGVLSNLHLPFTKLGGRPGRKSGVPGQKLSKVCAILHCKHAAKELADKKKSEVTLDRSCSSTGSSTGSSVDILEDATNGTKHRQNIRRTAGDSTIQSRVSPLSSFPRTVPSEFRHGLFPKSGHFQPDRFASSNEDILLQQKDQPGDNDEVLDLSVVKSVPQREKVDVVQLDSDDPQSDSEGSIITDISILRKPGLTDQAPVLHPPAVPTNVIEIQKLENRMYVYPVSSSGPTLSSVYSNAVCSTTMPSIPADGIIHHGTSPVVSLPAGMAGLPPLIPPPMTIPSGVQAVPRAGPLSGTRRRSRRQLNRKLPADEGMKLINENSLFPGVYTSTFKLPGCRRGRRNASAVSQSQSQLNQTVVQSSDNAIVTSGGMVMPGLPVQVQAGSQGSYMMMCPQVAVSSVLVKSPRKRGRPPKTPSISQFMDSPDKQLQANPTVNMPTSSMTRIMHQNSNNPVSLVYPSQPEQVNSFSPSLQQTNIVPQNLPPNHSQLMNILNHATSIKACNPIFIPNSSFQHSVQSGMPGNGTGLITIPLQQLSQVTGDNMNPMVLDPQQAMSSQSSAPMLQLQSSPDQNRPFIDNSTVHSKTGCGGDVSSTQPPSETGNILEPVTTKTSKSGIFQEMILSPQALVNVKPRSKPTTTELIRSNSNFYCGSFKIRPQKPTTQTGQGAPVKRGRGRPRLNIFESTRQKETKESRSRMYQELFHCKVCNEIFSAGERLSHQRKHVPVKLTCSSCGAGYQSYLARNTASFNRERDHPQCAHCKEIYGHDLSKKITEKSPECIEHVESMDCTPTYTGHGTEIEQEQLEYSEQVECTPCQTCGTICYTATEFRHHMRSHQERPFTCSEDGCSKLFRNSSELRRHVKHNHNQKEHLCIYDGCDKKFMKNFHLQEHVRVKHYNIKAFKCSWPGCEKEFAGIRHLKVHMLIHSDEKPLKCEFCEYRCRQRNALNWHMRKHPEVSFKYFQEQLGMESERDEQRLDMECVEPVGSDSVSSEPSPNGYEPGNDDRESEPDSDSSDISRVNEPSHSEVISLTLDDQ